MTTPRDVVNAPHGTPGRSEAEHEGSFRRELKNRHIQMIALGGAIGTGLFYGSAESISLAGPSILLAYVVGGLVIFAVVRALGEMSVNEPRTGAFSYYAYKHWSPRAGFVSGWNYWFNYVAVAMVELAVVGTFVAYWLPDVPNGVSAAFFLVTITAINLVGVRAFGEFEFWFALIKVVAVIGMIVLGVVVVVLAINDNPALPDPSFRHLVDDGGFFPHGVTRTVMALVVVMFSFGGAELVGITAGEASDPARTIPRAINQVIWRILLFYVLALAVIMAVVPWATIDGTTSPFVQIFDSVGVKGAAHVLNLVVLTAVMSVYSSALYSNGRMLHTLAHQGSAPAFLGRVGRNGVPVYGVLVSSAVTGVAVVVVTIWPDFAFRYLMAIATIAGVINWSMIVITQRKFRRRIGADASARLAFPLPGGAVTTWVVLAFLAGVVVLMALSPDYRTAVVVGPVWVALLLVAFELKSRRRGASDTLTD